MAEIPVVDLTQEHKPLSDNGALAAQIAVHVSNGAGERNQLIAAAVLALLDLSDAVRNIE